MKVNARVESHRGAHQVTRRTDNQQHPLSIAPKLSGFGSSANGASSSRWRWPLATDSVSVAVMTSL
jgi:hypothetical protein